jgi:hypothetical protein
MRSEPSKLARLVILYFEKFGRYLPESVLRRFHAGELVPILQAALANGVPLSDAEWDLPSLEFGPGGCIMREPGMPKKRSDGEWLH